MARNDQVRRQWRLWCSLVNCAQPRSAVELASDLASSEVSARTVRRDLEVLRDVGVPIVIDKRGREVRYAARGDGPELRLDADMLLSLQLALGMLRPFDGTPVGLALAQLTTRLQAKLPARVLAHFAPLTHGVVVRQDAPPEYRSAEPILDLVREALVAQRVIDLDYSDIQGRRTRRRVHPQALVYGPRGLYLLGHDDERGGALRTFRLERMLSARVTRQAARRDPGFDVDEYLAGSLGIHSPEHAPRTIVLEVHTEQALRVVRENPWHASQRLEHRRGSPARMTLELTSTRELLARVLAFGADLEVVEPVELRAEIAGTLARAAERYRGSTISASNGRSRSRSVRNRS